MHGGRLLLGGAPMRLVRLSPAGAERLDAWLAGVPVGSDPAECALARRLLDADLAYPVSTGGGLTTDDVTVVVPVKDNSQGLARLLTAVSDVPRRIVVDDGSAVPIAKSDIRHDVPRGPAAARNAGWRRADTAVVAFLDSDTIPDDRWLESLLPLFDAPSVAAVAPRIRSLRTGRFGRYDVESSSLDMGPDPALVRPVGRVRYVPSAALLVRRVALESVGGFDEDLRFGEDVDLVWRLADTGFSVRYQPSSVVRHEPRHKLGEWLRQRFDYGTSAAALAVRHGERLRCAQLSRAHSAVALLALIGHPIVATMGGVAAAARATHRLRSLDIPVGVAATTVTAGHVGVLFQVADALRRVWWLPALASRRRWAILAAAFLPPIAGGLRRGRGPVWLMMRIADDLAYGSGVWAGCLRHGVVEPLLPRIAPPRGVSR